MSLVLTLLLPSRASLKFLLKNYLAILTNTMKKTFYIEVVLLFILTVLLTFLLLDPFDLMMKLILSGVVLGLLATLYIIKFIVIWKEKEVDERDLHHRFYSSWVSYYTTSGLLFVGVIVESLSGVPDKWLIVSLAGLFITKLASLIYLEIYK